MAAPKPTAPPRSQLTSYQGTIYPLPHPVQGATHALWVVKGGRRVAVCYLASKRIHLNDWRGVAVVVTGQESMPEGLAYPMLQVRGITRQ